MMRFLQNLFITTLKRKLGTKLHPGVFFYSSLSQDISSMLIDAKDHNVIIKAGEDQNVKEFRVHSSILSARSPYFKNTFSPGWMIEIKKPNINPTVLEMILKYIYTDEVDLTYQTGTNIFGLLVASDEFLLEGLSKHVQDHLIKNQKTWVQQNFVPVLHTSFKLSSCKELQDYCLESICADPQPFITSKEFLSLDKDILHSLLKRDDLHIAEIVAWDYLIQWGIEQTPGLGNENYNIDKWHDNDFEALNKILNNFIPLIRFSGINSADFFDKVLPFKSIIPNNIYNEAMEFYMKGSIPKTTLPPRVGKYIIRSKIIESNLITTIINWIEKKDAKAIRNENDSLYNFNLIYRGSQDGIDNESFRNKCNDNLRVPILILIKCQGSRKIFGGYTEVGFGNKQGDDFDYYNICCTDSFIFSSENGDVQLSRVNNNRYANINNCLNPNRGFNFGDALYMEDQNLYADNYFNYYEKNLNSDNTYKIEEIEAYSVSKVETLKW